MQASLKEIFALLCSQLQAEENFNPRQDLYIVSIKFLHDFQIRLAILRLGSLRSNLRSNSAKFRKFSFKFYAPRPRFDSAKFSCVADASAQKAEAGICKRS